ncbi:stalk domain-containing protein [Chengkuizengella axinellae]|uniref:Stalk domain-containing protein n=1 Tax=Chengkuizengella axinellae TaxID=3064388 RepID=A0ABT9J270_9BACL|nr:stalk domain-containing protein [Chengkuizengella sp. 2205SS18-9]MDP5275522.1 stalk domain-containing protein [Chengkuizengella sp. 2205SS18-9]
MNISVKLLTRFKVFVIAALISSIISISMIHAEGTGVWEEVSSLNQQRINFQIEQLDDKIYAIGGMYLVTENQFDYLDRVEVYNIKNNTWTDVASMNEKRTGFQTVVLNDKIYAIGGYYTVSDGIDSSYIHLNSVEVYDPANDVWIESASMVNPLSSSMQAKSANSEIYVVKDYDVGWENGEHLYKHIIEVYNPEKDTWEKGASFVDANETLYMEELNGQIFLIGSDKINRYDSEENDWIEVEMKSLDIENVYLTEATSDKIILIGTSKNSTQVSSVVTYDPSTNSWTTAESLSTPIEGSNYSSLTLNGDIYVLDMMDSLKHQIGTLQVYDMVNDNWNVITNIYQNKRGYQATIVDEKVFIIGGQEVESYQSNHIDRIQLISQDQVRVYDLESDFSIVINDQVTRFDTPSLIKNGTTMVPMRDIFESLGAELKWDNQTKTVTAIKDDIKIVLQIGSDEAMLNNQTMNLTMPAEIINGSTLVPLRFVSESLGANVNYQQDENNKIISIHMN